MKNQSETSVRAIREFRAMTKRVSTSTTIALWVCLSMAIGLFIVSFFIPPKGVIDASVFKAAAYLFGFATLFELREAIREGMGIKLTHGDTTIEVHDLDGKQGSPFDDPNTHTISHSPIEENRE